MHSEILRIGSGPPDLDFLPEFTAAHPSCWPSSLHCGLAWQLIYYQDDLLCLRTHEVFGVVSWDGQMNLPSSQLVNNFLHLSIHLPYVHSFPYALSHLFIWQLFITYPLFANLSLAVISVQPFSRSSIKARACWHILTLALCGTFSFPDRCRQSFFVKKPHRLQALY